MSPSQKDYSLIVVNPPHETVLRSYSAHLQKRARAMRSKYAKLRDQSESVFYSLTMEFPHLVERIKQVQEELALRAQGTRDTVGSLDRSSDRKFDSNNPEKVSDRYLLKNAYRMASAIAHPDKGGSAEDFAAVHAAYQAGDLASLQEFVITRNSKVLIDQIRYWETEVLKPEAQWEQYRASPPHLIATAKLSGNTYVARFYTVQFLNLTLKSLLNQFYKGAHHG